MDIEATFNKDKYPVSILMTGTAEGETFKMKMEWSYDKNVTKTSSSIDFGGSYVRKQDGDRGCGKPDDFEKLSENVFPR